jgi:hypothetical protein
MSLNRQQKYNYIKIISTEQKGSNLAKNGIPVPDYLNTPTGKDQEDPKATNIGKRMLQRR